MLSTRNGSVPMPEGPGERIFQLACIKSADAGHVVVGPLFLGAVEPACRFIAAEDVARHVVPQMVDDLPERVRFVDESAFDDEPVALEVLDFAGCL